MEDEKCIIDISLFYFSKGKNSSESHKRLCSVYGNKSLSKRQCQNCSKIFIDSDFVVTDKQRPGCPVEVYDKEIKEIIEMDRHSMTCNIAEKLNVSHTYIEKCLQQMDYLKKMDLWVPNELTEAHLTQRINICDFLLKLNKMSHF